MKKISILILSTLITAAMISPLTNAIYIDGDEVVWYTVPELLEYKKEIENEQNEKCGEEIGCRQEWYFDRMERDDKLFALEQLMQHQFVVTAMNPGQGYIRALFFGEDIYQTLRRLYFQYQRRKQWRG